MSLRLEMLQVARLAPQLLGDSASLVQEFLLSRLNEDGGFADRAGESDLYYTVFGLDGLHALSAEARLSEVQAARVEPYLRSFEAGEDLDFIHLGCLARCWAALPGAEPAPADRDAMVRRIERHRTADGGFAEEAGAPESSLYGTFIGLGALQDLGAEILAPSAAADFIAGELSAGKPSVTPVVVAGITLASHLGRPVPPALGAWLAAQRHAQGGYLAVPGAPMPDLLSTATALHARASLEHRLPPREVESDLDFIDSLWTNRGAFHGSWADEELDCEYTFYGLLALGHLSVWNR